MARAVDLSCALAVGAWLSCSALVGSVRAQAQPTQEPAQDACVGLGCAGQVSVSGSVGASAEIVQEREPEAEVVTDVSLWVSPALSYFVATQVELSASLLVESYWQESGYGLDAQAYGVGLGAGFYVPFSSSVGLLPRASLFGVIRRTERMAFTGDGTFLVLTKEHETTRGLDAMFELPLLVELTAHVYLGIGLYLSFEIASSDSERVSGAGLLIRIGTWW